MEPTADRIEALADKFLTPRPSEPTPRDRELASEGRALVLGCGLAARAWGEAGRPVVLLAHGWEGRGTHWGAFVPALVAAGFRAVAVDAPAHGDSPGRQSNALDYGRHLAALGVELGPLAGVVAHSFGAAAVVVALDLGLVARRVVLISGPAWLGGFVTDWGRKHGLSEAELPAFAARVDAKVGAPVGRFDVPAMAPGMTVPALVVHDRDDEEIPLAHAEAVAAAWPGSELMVTERLGHGRVLIARAVVRRVVGFLGGEGL